MSSRAPRSVSPSRGAAAWGPPVQTESSQVRKVVHELQADLQLLLDDIRRGPMGRSRKGAQDYLRDLRREFLRSVHTRLGAKARQEEGLGEAEVHHEIAQLAGHFRTIVLGRAARVSGGWTPKEMVESLDDTVNVMPEVLELPYETRTFRAAEGDSVGRRGRRALLRAGRWLDQALAGEVATRDVEVQNLAQYHLCQQVQARAEALTSLFVQVDVHLAARTRDLFDRIVAGYQRLLGQSPVMQREELQSLRDGVEQELKVIEEEVQRTLADALKRALDMLSAAFIAIKEELPILGTMDLPSRGRRPVALVRERDKTIEQISAQLEEVRLTLSADYTQVGLLVEVTAFDSNARLAIARKVSELEADVRGRSHLHVERVLGAVVGALEALSKTQPQEEEAQKEESSEQPQKSLEPKLRSVLEPVAQVLTEASKALLQLLEQLTAEQGVAPLLYELNRQAHQLTDRYRVPVGRVGRTAWSLPAPLAVVEAPLRDGVEAYIQADVAPRLLEVTTHATARARPLVELFQELERLVTFNTELVGELKAGEEHLIDIGTPEQLLEVVLAALQRRVETLNDYKAASERWPEELGVRIRKAIFERITDLRARIAKGDIQALRLQRGRANERDERLFEQVDRVAGVLDRFSRKSASAVRTVVGEQRLDRLRAGLGIPEDGTPEPIRAQDFAPPEVSAVPVVYRRLFAAQAHWAGDVVTAHQDVVAKARRWLATGSGFRGAALLGIDGVGKGALVAAISRPDRAQAGKRISLNAPVSVEEIDRLLAEVPKGQLVTVTGLRWTLSARPGGFAPLRRLMERMLEVGTKNAWLLEADLLVWRYACRVAPIEELFSESIVVQPLAAPELEATILARHKLSGFQLRFSETETLTDLRGDRAQARTPAHERYFEALHEASNGLLQVALPMWVASLKEVDEKEGRVEVGAVPKTPHDPIRKLDEETLHLLFLIARQGWMDTETLASLLQRDHVAAQALLVRLVHLGVLERHADVFQVRSHLRGVVYLALKEQGWLQS